MGMWVLSSKEGPGMEREIGSKCREGKLSHESSSAIWEKQTWHQLPEDSITAGEMRQGKLRRNRWRATTPPWESQWGEEGWEKTAKDRTQEHGKMEKCWLTWGLRMCHWIITSPCLSSKLCQKELGFFCKIALLFCNTAAESLEQQQSKAWNFLHFAGAVCFLRKGAGGGRKKEKGKKKKQKNLKSHFLFDLPWMDRHMFKV